MFDNIKAIYKDTSKTNANYIRMLHCYAENKRDCTVFSLIKIRWNMCEGPAVSVTLLAYRDAKFAE